MHNTFWSRLYIGFAIASVYFIWKDSPENLFTFCLFSGFISLIVGAIIHYKIGNLLWKLAVANLPGSDELYFEIVNDEGFNNAGINAWIPMVFAVISLFAYFFISSAMILFCATALGFYYGSIKMLHYFVGNFCEKINKL